MYCVKKGGDRQELHEAIRRHSAETSRRMKLDGAENDLLQRILEDPVFGITERELERLTAAEGFTGRAREQTEEFLETVKKLIDGGRALPDVRVSVQV
jgi:adenylosuccinate lyase